MTCIRISSIFFFDLLNPVPDRSAVRVWSGESKQYWRWRWPGGS